MEPVFAALDQHAGAARAAIGERAAVEQADPVQTGADDRAGIAERRGGALDEPSGKVGEAAAGGQIDPGAGHRPRRGQADAEIGAVERDRGGDRDARAGAVIAGIGGGGGTVEVF